MNSHFIPHNAIALGYASIQLKILVIIAEWMRFYSYVR